MDKSVLAELKEQVGEAFYLLDSTRFRENFIELKRAFQRIYPNFNLAYSYKTNYTPKLCKIVNELGGYAEVVSEMELELALRIGVLPEKIIWNGPIKSSESMEKFLLTGGIINVDSLDDFKLVMAIVERNKGKSFKLGIRVNYDVCDGVISRFGFDAQSDELFKVLDYIQKSDNLELYNIQCHFAKRAIEYWPNRVKGMMELLDKINIVPRRIDLGGGLYGKMDDALKAQFASDIPSYDDYAKVVATAFAERFSDNAPELIIEPGSALVGDCMQFVGTVKSIKKIRGKWFASLLCSQKNISMTGVNPPIEVVNFNEGTWYKDIDLVGYTCIEGDVIYRGYVGQLAVGDVIIISNCGSYSLVMKPPFILPNFPVVDISEGKNEIIKRQETFEDVFRTFNF